MIKPPMPQIPFMVQDMVFSPSVRADIAVHDVLKDEAYLLIREDVPTIRSGIARAGK
ncbi:hypothetical protein [Nitrosovibrio tenuis]|uniref:Uncharacterized protein n=1 Tax=Nitrosovibrio tenuis TaxID=1233 RepID=A0A1H7IQ06_9PROT|nr:hypothetical protein [Nitrosovibrio tenuis]SEK64583.1 hypothetical protein SAMN05216387_102261 [Nitrosovibrio tenuis]